MKPAFAFFVLLLSVLLLGCKDVGESHYREARAQYESLVSTGHRPDAREFEPVLEKLRAVPPGSRAFRKAQALAASLSAARVRPPATPLATHSSAAEPNAALGAQREACSVLAQQLGTATGETKTVLEQALVQCRTRIGEMKEADEAKDAPPLPSR